MTLLYNKRTSLPLNEQTRENRGIVQTNFKKGGEKDDSVRKEFTECQTFTPVTGIILLYDKARLFLLTESINRVAIIVSQIKRAIFALAKTGNYRSRVKERLRLPRAIYLQQPPDLPATEIAVKINTLPF